MAQVGSGDFVFEPVEDWPQLPAGVELVEAVGVAVDSQDRVFIFNRGGIPILIFEADGAFVESWGEGEFARPHGIWIAPDDTLYLTDDMGHQVRHFTADGRLIDEIEPDGPSESGAVGFDYRTITHGAPPFNLPTNAVLANNGDLFVADGYGNARIHCFSGGETHSWGEPGDGPGEFNVPHGLGIDQMRGQLYVADRENSRIQIFSSDGKLVSEWTDVIRPCEVFVAQDDSVYVAEVGARAGLFPWLKREPDAIGGRLSIFDRDGNLLCRWGGGDDPTSPCDFYTPHDVWVDSQGSVYVGEVSRSAPRDGDQDPSSFPTLRKFARV